MKAAGHRTWEVLEVEREALFARTLSAFVRRDFSALEAAVREDVVLEMPGSSPISGVHLGVEAFGRYLRDASEAFGPSSKEITFEHQGDVMVATHEVAVRFPSRLVKTTVRVTTTFDKAGKVAAIVVE